MKIFHIISRKSSHPFFSPRNTAFFSTKKYNPKTCFYKILNVSTEANQDEIKKSYFELAKKYHPDTKFGDKVQEEKFKELHEAYKVLSDETSRKIYNEENGIESNWVYDKVNSGFGEKEDLYKKFSTGEKMTHEQMRERVKADEEFANYFEKKYFKNYEYFYKPPVEDDPFAMTPKLVRLKNEIKRKKRDNYVLHNAFTSKAYYEEKKIDENEEFGEKNEDVKSKFEVLQDLKFPFIFGFILLTAYTVCDAVYEANLGKKIVEKSKSVEKGSGYTLRLLPLNIA